MPNVSRPLDDVVGTLVGSSSDGLEFRQVLGRAVETSVHTTPDGRDWVAVYEAPVGDVVTPNALGSSLAPPPRVLTQMGATPGTARAA